MTIVERKRRPSAMAARPTEQVIPPTPRPVPAPALAGSALSRAEDPTTDDVERAMVVMSWVARSTISEIEKAVASRDPGAPGINFKMQRSGDLFSGIAGTLASMGHVREQEACLMAASTALASFFHGEVCRAAHDRLSKSAGVSDAQWALYERLAHRATVVWGKSAEAAREEAHRALAAMCDLFPDALDPIEDEDE
jgi:hypothetical protein